MVIEQDFGTAFFLYHVMAHGDPPSNYRFFVTPARQRKDPSISRQAFIADVVYKAVDAFQFGPKHLGIAQISVPVPPA